MGCVRGLGKCQNSGQEQFPDQGGNFPHRRFTFRARPQKIPCSDAQGIGSQDFDLKCRLLLLLTRRGARINGNSL
jgi:hypothetical protein